MFFFLHLMLALPGEAECFPLWWVQSEQPSSRWQLTVNTSMTSVHDLEFHILSIQDLKIACTLCRKLTPASRKHQQKGISAHISIANASKWRTSERTSPRRGPPPGVSLRLVTCPQHLTQRWNRLTLEEHVNVVDVQWGASIVLLCSSRSHLGAQRGVNLKEVRHTQDWSTKEECFLPKEHRVTAWLITLQ